MSAIAFLDANIVVYASGGPHAYRMPCQAIVEFAGLHRERFVSSAEVMQELLNLGLRRANWVYARTAIETLARCCLVESVEPADVMAAAEFELKSLQSRDLVHLAVMSRVGCSHVVSADRSFDTVPGVTRLDPLDFEAWRDQFAEDA